MRFCISFSCAFVKFIFFAFLLHFLIDALRFHNTAQHSSRHWFAKNLNRRRPTTLSDSETTTSGLLSTWVSLTTSCDRRSPSQVFILSEGQNCTIPRRTRQDIKRVVGDRQRITILLGDRIELSVIHTEAKWTVFLFLPNSYSFAPHVGRHCRRLENWIFAPRDLGAIVKDVGCFGTSLAVSAAFHLYFAVVKSWILIHFEAIH